MIRLYSTEQKKFIIFEDIQGFALPADALWIDLVWPSPEEEETLEDFLGFDLPTREELKDIEPSSRLYFENGVTYMTATVIWKADTDEPETTPVGFVLANDRLITIRYAEPKPFSAFAAYAGRHPEICGSGAEMLVGLLDALTDRIAEILEFTGIDIDIILRRVFSRKRDKHRPSSQDLENILTNVAFHQNMTSKVRDSLVSLGRMVSFLLLSPPIAQKTELAEHLRSLTRDIQSLTDHVSFLSNNISFMLDAALGLINLEQNAIVKIFSVAAVVFLPPTLVASIYGMNFAAMPELHWHFGYPMAIILMILSAILPYLWFKKRGWL
jgi:magnesium transporter